MKLLVDLGNSRIKWVLSQAGQFSTADAISLSANADFATLLDGIWGNMSVPSMVAVANVAGNDIAQQVKQWVDTRWQCPCVFVAVTLENVGVHNGYVTPLLLGADRWAAAIAAWHKYQQPLCVFDAGTSITLDIVDKTGHLLGGTISPGLELMMNSLVSGANSLQQELGLSYQIFDSQRLNLAAGDTITNISNGCLATAVAFLQQSRQCLRAQHGKQLRCLVTGGDATLLMSYLDTNFEHHPSLVLEGVDLLTQ